MKKTSMFGRGESRRCREFQGAAALLLCAFMAAWPLRMAAAQDSEPIILHPPAPRASTVAAAQDPEPIILHPPAPRPAAVATTANPERVVLHPPTPPAPAVAAPATIPPTSAPASSAVVINLINLLVQEGVLTRAKADALIHQAQDEAVAAARAAPAPSTAAITNVAVPSVVSPSAAPSAQAATISVRVPYIPQIVKNQITDEVKQEVLQQAKAENWAAPNALPEWTKRFHPYGDFRLRYEWDLFDQRNATIPNFAALDGATPFDLDNSAGTPAPQLNTTANRQRMRIRARLGTTIDIADGFTADVRLATGNTTNPVSTNQTLGTTLNKDNILLDRLALIYRPTSWATISAGRIANPWFYTDLVWSPELNFDGVAVQIAPQLKRGFTPFFTAGAFPIENTPFNFPDNTAFKENSRDKWLFGAQAGLGWQPSHDYNLKVGAALYYYTNIDGKFSSPCAPTSSADVCNTDDSRPDFLQQGNTLFEIRNTVNLDPTNPHEFFFYGLAAKFHELNLTGQFDYARFDPIHVIFDGDFVTNLGFNKNAIIGRGPWNNLGPSPGTDANGNALPGPWAGGANGFQARVTVGHPTINERWDWNVSAAYKYIESDAVVDAFTDSDFHLGGTNAKGYILGANLGVAHNVWLTGRWLSASEISGPPYSVDVVQVDLNARF